MNEFVVCKVEFHPWQTSEFVNAKVMCLRSNTFWPGMIGIMHLDERRQDR